MSDPDTYNQLIEIMLDEDDDALGEFVLMEAEKDQVLAGLGGDTTLMNYMMMFEEFLEQHDIYLFDGWEEASFAKQPSVEKFWITFHLLVGENADLRGAKRVRDAMNQGDVTAKRLEDGSMVVIFQVLKRSLDQIEAVNKEKIEKLSDQAMEEL